MRRTLTLLILALLVAAPSWASLAVTICTIQRCVLASDSRTWDTVHDVFGGDTARKVDIRDGFGFTMTGYPSPFDAWLQTTPRPGESAEALARRVLAAIEPDDEIQEAVFAILKFGAPIDVHVIKAEIHPDGTVVTLQDVDRSQLRAPFAFSFGWDAGGQERDTLMAVTQQELTRTTPTEARMVEIARGILTAASRQSPKVGGPQHIAIVDAAGARWQTPSRHGQHWDGTNLTIVSAGLTIGSTGITIATTTSAVWDAPSAFKFSYPSDDTIAGLSGTRNGSVRYLNLEQTVDTGIDSRVTIRAEGADNGAASLSLISDTVSLDSVSAVLSATSITLQGETAISAIASDGTGKIVCIKSDTTLGTCNATTITTSGCTCS